MKNQITIFDDRFSEIHCRSVLFVDSIHPDKLFWKPRELERTFAAFSCGEYVLRSAAAVEQAFGGITTKLWDDPFEWTLPEELSTNEKIMEYLNEVEKTRQKGFGFFASDNDLMKQIPAPERLRSIFVILLEAVARAEHFQGRAFAVFQMFSNAKLPRV